MAATLRKRRRDVNPPGKNVSYSGENFSIWLLFGNELRRYDGVIHGFFSMGDMIAKGKTAVQHATGALRKAYGQSS